ncbi:MAG: MATE family efflux transporter [Erysipelotrichaceae bacterium]|nr:MATE family efflux transporter [Erysipelotrichaceae bacterium]
MLKSFDKFKFDKNFFVNVLSIAIPLMLQQLIVSGVNLIDNLMVGQLGDISLGGVTAVNKYYMVATTGMFGMTTAAGVFLAQYYGAKNNDRLKQTFRFMLVSTLLLGTVFFLIGFLFPENVLRYFTNDLLVISEGINYFKYAIFTLLPISITLSVSNSMRSIGETKYPIIMSIVAVIVNTSLNYCLIFGNFGFPRLGVAGAAIATLIARIIEMIIGLYLLQKYNFEFITKLKDLFKINLSLVKAILLKALPLTTNEILWSSGMATIFKLYSKQGLVVMTGLAISSTVTDIFFTLFGGMAITTTVLVSHKLGANKIEEAKSNAYKLIGVSVTLSLMFALGLFISSFFIPLIYNNVSLDSKIVAMNMIRIQGGMYWIYMLTVQSYFILRAGGDMKSTLVVDSGFMWLFNIPVIALVITFTNWNYLLVYFCGQATDIIKLLFSYHLLKKEKWAVNLTHQVN